MKFTKIRYFLLLVLLPAITFSQQSKTKFSISGIVLDKETGESLIGASVGIVGQKGLGTVTNSYGFYSVSAVQGHYQLTISFSSYKTDTI